MSNKTFFLLKTGVKQQLFMLAFTACLLASCASVHAQKPGQATSGRVNTMEKFSFKYGRLEAEIKTPLTNAGLWPAFWLLGADFPDVNWPRCGEIDVMEMGHAQGIEEGIADRFVSGACHWGETPDRNHPKYDSPDKKYGKNLQDEFHRYTLIWNETSVSTYIDDDPDPYFRMDIWNYPVKDYFNKEFFIILNLAVGGQLPEIFDISEITALGPENNYTASMYVDYVRVYDLEGTLIWNDEFDFLDESKWNIEVRNDGGGNSELQYYKRENVSVGTEPETGRSCLVLTAMIR